MPCSVSLNSAELAWAPAYRFVCVGGAWNRLWVCEEKCAPQITPSFTPPHTCEQKNLVTQNSDEMLHSQISSRTYYVSPLPVR